MTQETQTNMQTALPDVTFSTFILSLASSALAHLGEVPQPDTGKIAPNIPVAAHTIDVLDMLYCTMVDGPSEEDKKVLQNILYELRIKYLLHK